MANRVTRRQFMTRSGLAVGGAMIAPQLLAACGGDDSGGGSEGSYKGVYFENWPEYIDTAKDGSVDGPGTTLANFTKQTGIPIKYTETYNDNNEYFAKIQPLLSKGRKIDPDMIAPTFWMAGRLINLGWVEKLDLDKIPNASNLRSALQKPTWDPTGEYSLPWQSGFAGIAWPREWHGQGGTPMQDAIYLLEEPENGVHPRAIETVTVTLLPKIPKMRFCKTGSTLSQFTSIKYVP